MTYFVVGFPGFPFPDGLVPGTTNYWRIDDVEADGVTKHKGTVWSFTTAKAGGGVRGDYYRGMNFENLALGRIDPQIDFDWGGGEPDPAVGADQFSVRWTGEAISGGICCGLIFRLI